MCTSLTAVYCHSSPIHFHPARVQRVPLQGYQRRLVLSCVVSQHFQTWLVAARSVCQATCHMCGWLFSLTELLWLLERCCTLLIQPLRESSVQGQHYNLNMVMGPSICTSGLEFTLVDAKEEDAVVAPIAGREIKPCNRRNALSFKHVVKSC